MPNRLANENSPYLRQHMNDPVDWYPWCGEAFEKAKKENKPIFLSIGYSTCHWCHVMAQESFRSPAVAELLNRNYISVKVDREERPDVDSLYMRFCVGMNGSGGWPLTVLMTPEGYPFYTANYLPREGEGGRLGLIPLLKAVSLKWRKDRAGLVKISGELSRALAASLEPSRESPSEEHVNAAVEQLKASYDAEYGGFGTAPKFPAAHNLIFLMQAAKLSGEKELRAMVENTLRQMYRGGIYDHFGGGFCRYSTDREWLAPHFEKTLYDNALLALCYTEAWQDGHLALYRNIAEDTLDYCLRELKDENGGFFCGQDADCGGVEGAYYLFNEQEVVDVIGREGKSFAECYDLDGEPNFHGGSIPNLLLNSRWNMLPEGYGEFREQMRLYRERRMTLPVDNKILSAWNGLMLMALSRAAAAFGDKRYLMEAEELAAFIAEKLSRDGKLMACLCGGRLSFAARLDDLVFCALGLLELYAACFDCKYISAASSLAETVLEKFADEGGGFFLTADDAEALILRPKEITDGAMPSGNSAAAVLFARLAGYTGDNKWREALDKQLGFICGSTGNYPAGAAYALTALLGKLYGTKQIVCAVGDAGLPESLKMIAARCAPGDTVMVKTSENAGELARLAPFTADMSPVNGKAAYYICSNGVCGLPVTEL